MRRCMHRVLGFIKPALESIYLPLFTDPDIRRNMDHETQKSMHASLHVYVGLLTINWFRYSPLFFKAVTYKLFQINV